MKFQSQQTPLLKTTSFINNNNNNNSYDGNNDTDITTSAISILFNVYSSANQASLLHNTIAAVTLSLISIFVLVSNCTVIAGISQRRIWRRRSLRFFVLLVVTDLLVGLLTLPIHVVIYAVPSVLGDATTTSESDLVSLTRFFLTFPIILSMMTVFLITLDRFFAIVKTPVHKQYATNRFVFIVIATSILLALTWGILSLTVLYKTRLAMVVSMVTLGAVKTAIFISVCVLYRVVMRAVQRTATTTRVSFVSNVSSPPNYDRAFSKLSLIICAAFMTCHLPSIVAHFYIAHKVYWYTKTNLVCFYMVTWTNVPMFLNSGINGVLLVYGNRKLKRWFMTVCEGIFEMSRGMPRQAVSPRERKNAIIGNDVNERRIIERVAINFRIDIIT